MSKSTKADKELYHRLRLLTCDELWRNEATPFDKAPPEQRLQRVALIRAIGVVFSESGTDEQKALVKPWLRRLVHDPCEKIRRYAMAALPKVGAGPAEESELLSLLRKTTIEREKKFLSHALEKIGGAATLVEMEQGIHRPLLQTVQKVRASVARTQSRSLVRRDKVLSDADGLRIHLRGRRGLERIVQAEIEEFVKAHGKFRVADARTGLVAITPTAPFKLDDIYRLRCFGSLGFLLGAIRKSAPAKTLESLAAMITSPMSLRLLKTFTEGPIRYRLDFVSEGHQRGAVRQLADLIYAKCPELLNDARDAPWEITIRSGAREDFVELCPKLADDPRFSYRQRDVPAASHPPLAACLARMAGRAGNEIVWDPFCGSGLELIERALLGGVRSLYGTDRSPDAIAISEQNFAAANVKLTQAKFICCDFREFAKLEGLSPNTVSLVITNPPMGKRVPIPNLRLLIEDLYLAAAQVLRPGGRLVLANPLLTECPQSSLKLQSRQVVDLGGFDCRLEVYLKLPR